MENVKETLSKKEALKIIKETWNKINGVLSVVHFGQYGNQFLALSTKEEKEHRGIRLFDGECFGLTISEASKLFCVRRIVEALNGEKIPEIKDILHCQPSWFFAHSLVANYREELSEALKDIDKEKILSLDYAELVKV
jgi:hypothetical protein